MCLREILLGITVLVPLAQGACGGNAVVRDWGLHRAWQVERACGHPELPAVLVEVRWTEAPGAERSAVDTASTRATKSPEVHAGMRVTVTRQDDTALIHLVGTALGTAHVGERVALRVRGSGTILHGLVRGPGTIELETEKGGK